MTLLPKNPADVALAPVAVQIDLNLRALRDRPPEEIEYELQLQLDRPAVPDTPDERADRVAEVALRDIDLHGWAGAVTDDSCRLRLSGGSVTVDLGLGDTVMRYIQNGVRSPAGHDAAPV